MTRFVPRAAALAVASVFLAGASLSANAFAADNSDTKARAENPYLSQTDAAARSARVSKVAYVLDFTLTGKESFAGTTTVQFDLKDKDAPLTLDLDKATIKKLVVNGKEVQPQYNNWFITLAAADLVAGRNTVRVEYERLHSTNGEGLHRMVDPVDGRVYTYSHFEPAAAHQMFALFDQPDLKATYQVNVSAPADWTVVSTTRETKVEDAGTSKHWTFPVSKILSPYNFSMHAGPYKVWEDKSGKYPMRLLARQSVASQVTPEEWFKYTKEGLAWFDEYFGVPYQYEKYDQLLVPDFLYGAMENAGAITFAEHGFLYKDKMTSSQRHSLASVIMHEMAHQWFGDLVTMQWWNGLWLNESFASFMGTLATAEATEFKNAWQYFYGQGKVAAYTLDQQVVTHPIEVPVPSTANAFDNIDAITYSKGASTLKQLRHLLGEETFRKGVHNYLVKYQWKNAKLDDFIGSLGEAAGRDLSQWTQEWLYQPGVNTVTANYSCAGGKISNFSLQQTASAQFPVLREQRVQLALMDKSMKLNKVLAVTYKGANTEVPELKGAACPDMVYPNYQDWGFVKAKLDQRSFATARKSMNKVDDVLLRTMLWQSLWDGVRDGELPLNEFLQTVLNNAPSEKDYVLLGDVLGKTGRAQGYLDTMNPNAAYVRKTAAALEQMAWKGAQSSADDFQRRWFASYVNFATTPEAQKRLAGVLDGSVKIKGMNVSQDLRWSIIQRLNSVGYADAAALLAAEKEKDKSDTGQASALAASVSRPDAKVKEEWLAQINDAKTKLPFNRLRTAMEYMYPASQNQLAEQSASQRLAQLPLLDKATGPVFMRSYGTSMIPHGCTTESVQRLSTAAEQYKDLSAGSRRALLITQQEDQRCVMIRKALTVPLS